MKVSSAKHEKEIAQKKQYRRSTEFTKSSKGSSESSSAVHICMSLYTRVYLVSVSVTNPIPRPFVPAKRRRSQEPSIFSPTN